VLQDIYKRQEEYMSNYPITQVLMT